MKLYDSLVAAAVRPYRDDVVHHFGREAMKRRPAAFRAAAPFTSLRLRHKDRGEALAVGALVAGVAAGFDDRVDVRRQIVAVGWESGSGTEECDEDTVATSIGSMAIVRSDSRIKRRFQGRRTSRHKYDTKERIIQPVRVDDRRGGGGKQKERGTTAACSSRSGPGRA